MSSGRRRNEKEKDAAGLVLLHRKGITFEDAQNQEISRKEGAVRPWNLMRVFLVMAAILFGLVLALPGIHRLTGWPPDRPLGGVEAPVPEAEWGMSGWWNGTVQPAFETWYSREIGLRGALVRTANQIAYSLFGELAQGKGTRVIPGRNGFLYESVYVDAYRRGGQRSKTDLRRISAETRRLQDRLAADGIGFWLVIAPSKAEIYPEHLPREADTAGRAARRSPYEDMIGFLKEDGVNVVDGHALFQEWKRGPDSPMLFPQGGTHWNRYGMARIVSILMDRLRETTGKDWPSLKVTGSKTSRKIIPPDNDLGELANLWQRRSLAGPQIRPVLEIHPGTEKPDLLLICDSFGAMVGQLLEDRRLIRRHDAYYYNKRHQGWPRRRKPGPAPDPELPVVLQRVAGRDAVVIVQVEYFLPEIGFGFAKELLEAYDAVDDRAAPSAS